MILLPLLALFAARGHACMCRTGVPFETEVERSDAIFLGTASTIEWVRIPETEQARSGFRPAVGEAISFDVEKHSRHLGALREAARSRALLLNLRELGPGVGPHLWLPLATE